MTRSGLEELLLWLLSPADFSLRHTGHVCPCSALKREPPRWNMGVSERIEVNSLVLLSPEPTLTLRGWLAMTQPRKTGVGLARGPDRCKRTRYSREMEEEKCSHFEIVCFLFWSLWQRIAAWALEQEFAASTSSISPRTGRSDWWFTRGSLGGGLAAVRLGPLLFLTLRSGWHRRCGIQRYLGLGSLSLRKQVASGWAGTLLRLRLDWLGGSSRLRLRGLLSRRRLGMTRGSCRARAFGQEMLHGQGMAYGLSHSLGGM